MQSQDQKKNIQECSNVISLNKKTLKKWHCQTVSKIVFSVSKYNKPSFVGKDFFSHHVTEFHTELLTNGILDFTTLIVFN